MENNTDSPAGIADGEKRIAEILVRHENATHGPWKQRINYSGDPSAGWVVTSHGAKSGQQRTICFMSDGYGSGNHEFIANSWDDVSYLLAERESLIARLNRAEAERDILRTRVVAQEAAWLERLMQSLEKESVKSIVEERDRLREALDALKPFVNLCTVYEDHIRQFKWSDPVVSESIVGVTKFGGNEVSHIKMGHLRSARDAYNAAAALADAGKGGGE